MRAMNVAYMFLTLHSRVTLVQSTLLNGPATTDHRWEFINQPKDQVSLGFTYFEVFYVRDSLLLGEIFRG